MIKKSIITATVLFLVYTAFVQFGPSQWSASQHQWQKNIIKAQNYLFSESDTIKNIIVGSSLSNRIIMDSLANTYNLSFSGQSIFDGLKILSAKKEIPKRIFIEMNFVLRPEMEEFTKTITSPVLNTLRKNIVSLREEKQPIAVLGKIQVAILNKIIPKPEAEDQEPFQDHRMLDKMISTHLAEFEEIPSNDTLTKTFAQLTEYIHNFEKKGATIVFFEVPVNSRLQSMPKARIVRESFHKYFPDDKYRYISLPEKFECRTTDGLHLNPQEASLYTNYLKLNSWTYFN